MKMRCKNCVYYNYDFFDDRYENGSFCGLHGRVFVNPLGDQVNLDHKGSCGFFSRSLPVQLYFDFDL